MNDNPTELDTFELQGALVPMAGKEPPDETEGPGLIITFCDASKMEVPPHVVLIEHGGRNGVMLFRDEDRLYSVMGAIGVEATHALEVDNPDEFLRGLDARGLSLWAYNSDRQSFRLLREPKDQG